MSPRTRTLLLMRHAKSSWRTSEPDQLRPLNDRGIRDAHAAGRFLRAGGVDVVLHSPARRAAQTWECVRDGGVACDDVRTVEALYHAWTPEVLAELQRLPSSAGRVLVIGHQPLISELALTLSMTSPLTPRVEERYPTSAIAVLEHQLDWDEFDYALGTLVAFEVPRG